MKIKTNLTLMRTEREFVEWMAKRDNVTLEQELQMIFDAELNLLLDLHEDEWRSERKARRAEK